MGFLHCTDTIWPINWSFGFLLQIQTPPSYIFDVNNRPSRQWLTVWGLWLPWHLSLYLMIRDCLEYLVATWTMVIGKMMLAIKTMAMMVMISIMMLKEEKQLWVLFCEPTIDYFLASGRHHCHYFCQSSWQQHHTYNMMQPGYVSCFASFKLLTSKASCSWRCLWKLNWWQKKQQWWS